MRILLSFLTLDFLGLGWSTRHEGMGEGLWIGLTFGVPFLVFAYRSWSRKLEIFERGVRCRGWGFTRELRDEEVESMVLWTREESDWNDGLQSSAGCRVCLRLEPVAGSGAKPIRFEVYRLADVDYAFSHLEDRLVKRLSARMLERIAAGERVHWGRHAVFTRAGLHFRRRKWLFFRGPEEILEQCAFYSGAVKDGRFCIYELGWTSPIFTMTEREPNFKAGALIFSTVRYQTDH